MLIIVHSKPWFYWLFSIFIFILIKIKNHTFKSLVHKGFEAAFLNEDKRSMKITQLKDDQQQLEDMKWALKRHCFRAWLYSVYCRLRDWAYVSVTYSSWQRSKAWTSRANNTKSMGVKEGKTQKICDMYIANLLDFKFFDKKKRCLCTSFF